MGHNYAKHLRGEFYALIGAFQPWQVVHMCGSGVTACHNLLAIESAGRQCRGFLRRLGVGGSRAVPDRLGSQHSLTHDHHHHRLRTLT